MRAGTTTSITPEWMRSFGIHAYLESKRRRLLAIGHLVAHCAGLSSGRGGCGVVFSVWHATEGWYSCRQSRGIELAQQRLWLRPMQEHIEGVVLHFGFGEVFQLLHSFEF